MIAGHWLGCCERVVLGEDGRVPSSDAEPNANGNAVAADACFPRKLVRLSNI
jgi:hypothetical protein